MINRPEPLDKLNQDPFLVEKKSPQIYDETSFNEEDDSTNLYENNNMIAAQNNNVVNNEFVEPCHIIVEIYHKQRGGKGIWNPIDTGTLIRVTKNIGKRVKLVIRAAFKFNRDDVTLHLIDHIHPNLSPVQEGRFSIENVLLKENELGGSNAEFEMKIFTLSKKLEFRVNVNCSFGQFPSESNYFGTHNSGKLRKKKDSVERIKKKVLVPLQGHPPPNHTQTPPPSPHPSKTPPHKHKSEFIEDRTIKKFKPSTPPPDLIHSEIAIDPYDLRAKLSLQDLIREKEFIEDNPNSVHECMINAIKSDFDILSEYTRRLYPESCIPLTREIYGIKFCDMLPLVLYNLNFVKDLPLDIINENLYKQYQYSSNKISNDVIKFIDIIISTRRRYKDEYHGRIIKEENYVPMRMVKEEKLGIMKMKEFEMGDMKVKNILDINVIPKSLSMGVKMGLIVMLNDGYSEDDSDFFLVIYKQNVLFTDKPETISRQCKYILIKPEFGENYNGNYSVVLFLKRPGPSFLSKNGYIGLFDARGIEIKQLTTRINPVPITQSGNKDLWIISTFTVKTDETKWTMVDDNSRNNSNYPPNQDIPKEMFSPPPIPRGGILINNNKNSLGDILNTNPNYYEDSNIMPPRNFI